MMKIYAHFRATEPEVLSKQQKEWKDQLNASYIQDENGHDWYELQKTFQADSIKVVFEPEKNLVVAMEKDASRLFPLNNSIVELDAIPEGASNNGEWVFDGHQVIRRTYTKEERRQQAQKKKDREMDRVTKMMAPLQDAVDLGIATEQEVATLHAWKAYRVALHRLQPSEEEMVWPERPEG